MGDITCIPTGEGWALSGHRQGLVYRQKGGLCLFQSY